MKEYIEREAVKAVFDGIYDCADMVFEPNDHCCSADDCGRCKWAQTKNAIKKMVMGIPAADVVDVQDALAFSQIFNLDEYREKEDRRDCDFVFGVLMRLGIVCLKTYDPITRTMRLWAEKIDGGVNDGKVD